MKSHVWGMSTQDGGRCDTLKYAHVHNEVVRRVAVVALCQVYLSMRNGAWCLSRVFDNGLPLDLAVLTRFKQLFMRILPLSFVRSQSQKKLHAHLDHALYRLQLDYQPYGAIVVNDYLPSRILSGRVQVRPGIARLTSSGVEFDDGTFVDDIDTVICATG